jgi:hypothetical protein
MLSRFKSLYQSNVAQILDFLKYHKTLTQKTQSELTDELEDMIDTRLSEGETYTGQELIDALEDVPDITERILDHELEHQRDIALVLIRNVFAQAQAKSQNIWLAVSRLEDEQMVNQAHSFCVELLRDPNKVLAEAPKDPAAVGAARSKRSGNDEIDSLLEENARLRAEIEAQLKAFPQYVKTLEMIHQRDVEINGMSARL